MKSVERVLCGLLGLILITAAAARAQETKPIEISLFTPVQIFGPDEHIAGVRLNFIYGKNASMTGIDVGVVNVTTEDVTGVQFFGVVNLVGGDLSGYQKGLVNIVEGRTSGIQVGLYNETFGGDLGQLGFVNRVVGDSRGVAIGFVNQIESGEGFMLGLVNIANSFRGLQIGLVNMITEKERWGFLPIVNWRF